ncbi:hypothetical protein [Conexibacter sp. CPCC 206217]|uniref:hypothetical protein n=1 Tax=Conexibacter sp. CPCC 206217 TaxID=3064574 RepID=UPI0027228644|nr:hypothetical protein [Conexibacter sp. CPCC 206217]MDO8209919.1 hypothetical protein [Conexibacter sp. CPCC 206217]
MKFNKLADKAKQAIERRGGMDSLKEDLQEVKDAATGRGSLKDKARAAADALKTPGKNPETPAANAPATPPPAPPATPPAVPPTTPPDAA